MKALEVCASVCSPFHRQIFRFDFRLVLPSNFSTRLIVRVYFVFRVQEMTYRAHDVSLNAFEFRFRRAQIGCIVKLSYLNIHAS